MKVLAFQTKTKPTGRTGPNLAELLGVVDEIIETDGVVEALEMLLGHLEGFVGAFLDGDRWHGDDELGEAVATIQLEDASEVRIDFAWPGFHLNSKVEIAELG